MQGRAWYGVLAGWLLNSRRNPRDCLWSVWPRRDPVGSENRISHAGLQSRSLRDFGRRRVRNSCGSVVGRTTSQAGRRGVTEEHMSAAIDLRGSTDRPQEEA